jgi:hypothetical protein
VNGKTTKPMERVPTIPQTMNSIKGNGKTIYLMAEENISSLMIQHSKEIIGLVRRTDTEFVSLQEAVIMKENGSKMRKVGLELINIHMADKKSVILDAILLTDFVLLKRLKDSYNTKVSSEIRKLMVSESTQIEIKVGSLAGGTRASNMDLVFQYLYKDYENLAFGKMEDWLDGSQSWRLI